MTINDLGAWDDRISSLDFFNWSALTKHIFCTGYNRLGTCLVYTGNEDDASLGILDNDYSSYRSVWP